MLEDFMKQLSKEMEMDQPFIQETPGIYALRFGTDYTVNISQIQGGGIHFSATVAPCPRDRQEVFFTNVMLANLFGQGTKGGVLGLNTEGTQLTLSKVLEYNIDYKEFRNNFEDFINAVDFWRDEALAHK